MYFKCLTDFDYVSDQGKHMKARKGKTIFLKHRSVAKSLYAEKKIEPVEYSMESEKSPIPQALNVTMLEVGAIVKAVFGDVEMMGEITSKAKGGCYNVAFQDDTKKYRKMSPDELEVIV